MADTKVECWRPHQSPSEGRRVEQASELIMSVSLGDQNAVNKLLPLVYDELRAIAARRLQEERADHTLQATALVNEAYLRMADQTKVNWQGKAHFCAVAATMMRRILVDHARQKNAAKRQGRRNRLPLSVLIYRILRQNPLMLLSLMTCWNNWHRSTNATRAFSNCVALAAWTLSKQPVY